MNVAFKALVTVLLVASCKGDDAKPALKTDPVKSRATPSITITNACSMDVWMAFTPNAGSPPLSDGIVKLPATTGSHSYTLPATGWAGRFWPKTGCDTTGENCKTGQAVPPCPPDGCQPPADTKVEFFFGPEGGTERPYYDVSLVDGYSLPMKITPSGTPSGTCVETSCALSLDACPKSEILKIGDLQVKSGKEVVQCMSPCKKWTWPKPLGDGQNEGTQPGLDMCCPNPPVSPMQCRAADIEKTKYVALVRQECPTAYSYSFDDKAGSHDCDPGTTFSVTLCP